MKVATRKEIQQIDRLASQDYAIPSIILMENAGQAVFESIRNTFPNFKSLHYTVFCGKGNNGGDGAVVARKLFLAGARVKSYFVGDSQKATGDARVNFEIARTLSIPYDEVKTPEDWSKCRFTVQSSDVFIDAIFGIGFHGEPQEPFISIAQTLNHLKNSHPEKKIIAVDIPSGIYADFGTSSLAIHADMTITFGLPKPGLIHYPGNSFVGKLEVDSINLPPALLKNSDITLNLLTEREAAKLLPTRPQNSHKGSFGHLLVIGGQKGMIGAPLFCAKAALRSGVGLVTLALPAELTQTAQSQEPAVMVLPYSASPQTAVLEILDFIRKRKITSVVIGNGLGKSPKTAAFLSALLGSNALKSLVLDADALNTLAEDEDLKEQLKNTQIKTVLTPHLGEVSRLTGKEVTEIRSFKENVAEEIATEFHSAVLLKDAISIATFPDGQKWLLNRGNTALSKGGSGDILAGLIGGLLTTGVEVQHAVLLGSFLLGLSAELLTQIQPSYSVLPEDVLNTLPRAWKYLLECGNTE